MVGEQKNQIPGVEDGVDPAGQGLAVCPHENPRRGSQFSLPGEFLNAQTGPKIRAEQGLPMRRAADKCTLQTFEHPHLETRLEDGLPRLPSVQPSLPPHKESLDR
jgi:hypothetical protein